MDSSPASDSSSGGSGGRGDASPDTGSPVDSGQSGTICQQAANKLTSCGVSTGGIASDCTTQNACYSACMLSATCAELQGPTTANNSYTACLSGC
jgi:hypothetical protein